MSEQPIELIEARLYRIFRIKDESYIVSVKLRFIYRWVERTQEGDTFSRVEQLRSDHLRRGKMKVLEEVYRAAEHATYLENGRYASPDAKVPQVQDAFIAGWHL
jgi:hypothetical protein